MSVRVMADVWDSTIEDATRVAVLVCLANFADDDGTNCFPGIARLARMTRFSERTVIRAISRLALDGWIQIVGRGGGQGHLTGYVINVAKLKQCQSVTVWKKARRMTLTTRKGDTDARKGDFDDNPPHPLFGGTVIDPSVTRHPQTPSASEGADRNRSHEFAIDQVCSALGIANRRKRKLLRNVIELECEKGEEAPTIALAMISAWKRQAAVSHLLTAKYGLDKFFGLGIWADERRWHWNEELLRKQAEASTGSW